MLNTASNAAKRARTGAARQSWKRSPREVLADLVDSMPRAKSESDSDYSQRILCEFKALVADKPKLVSSIIEYWFTNDFRSLMMLKLKAEPSVILARKAEAERIFSETRAALSKAVEMEARIILMDLMMPNGKRLRACTGEECKKLSVTTGRWLSGISNRLKPKQKVGEVLSEDELHRLYDAA